MGVVWQSSKENGTRQTGVKGPRQRVTKGPVAEAAPAARGLEEAGGPRGEEGMGEPSLAAGDPGEPAPAARDPGEPAPAAGDPREGEKRRSQRQRQLCCCLGLTVGELLLWLLLALGIAFPSSIAYFFLKDPLHHHPCRRPQP